MNIFDLPNELLIQPFLYLNSFDSRSLLLSNPIFSNFGADSSFRNKWFYKKNREISGDPEEFDIYTYRQPRDYEKDYDEKVFDKAFNEDYKKLKTKIKEFPNTINFGSRSLKLIPREIGQLVNLKYLYLSNNQLREIPREIGEFANLRFVFK